MQNLKPAPEERAPNDDLLRTRLPATLKARIEAAASVLGLDVSTFVRQTIARESDDVLKAQTHHEMTPADVEAFAAALDTPPEPTPAALRAASRYRARVVHAD
ncbi:DUF1778 domain-containing protein [Breoghania sp.]|uniref:type II toxin-antitoxin system TacA family antitoxin n=1 Tax=Breoghania sp. TaxID=2065378 RepID=UPI002AA83ABA|nr:DUF1778 domain-containing protein [Breoghania sp.]